MTSRIRVAVRVRPLSSGEKEAGDRESICVDGRSNSLTINGATRFTYDWAAPPSMSQAEFYTKTVHPLVAFALSGINATVMAYGQTSSGKTFTMGSEQCRDVPAMRRGIIPRFVEDLFLAIGTSKVVVTFSLLELYNEKARDLLSASRGGAVAAVAAAAAAEGGEEGGEAASLVTLEPQAYLRLRESDDGSVVVAGLSEREIDSPEELLELLGAGLQNRVTAATEMNAVSSRSHCIGTIALKISSTVTGVDGETTDEFRTAKVTFVDLAGSERAKRTGATGMRMQEGISINKSLLTLGQVINALGTATTAGGHIPYRDSKLTRLLQDALGGNSKTVFIACVSPAQCNVDESLNSLRYANRARNIKNAAVINMSAAQMQVKRLRDQLEAVTRELVKHAFGGGKMTSTNDVNELLAQPRVRSYLGSVLSVGTATMPSACASSAPPLPPTAADDSAGSCAVTAVSVAAAPSPSAASVIAGEGGEEEEEDDDHNDLDDTVEEDEEATVQRGIAEEANYQLQTARIEDMQDKNSEEEADVQGILDNLFTPAEEALDPEAQAREIEDLETALAKERSDKVAMEAALKSMTGAKQAAMVNGPQMMSLKAKLKEKSKQLQATEKRLGTLRRQCRELKEKCEQRNRYQEQLRALKQKSIKLRKERSKTEKEHRASADRVQRRINKLTRAQGNLKKTAAKAARKADQQGAIAKRQKRETEKWRAEATKAKQQLLKFLRRRNASNRRGGRRTLAGGRRGRANDSSATTTAASSASITNYVAVAAQRLMRTIEGDVLMKKRLKECAGEDDGASSSSRRHESDSAAQSRAALLVLIRAECDNDELADVFPSTTNACAALMMLEEQIQERVFQELLVCSAQSTIKAQDAAIAKQARAAAKQKRMAVGGGARRASLAGGPLVDVTDTENTPIRSSSSSNGGGAAAPACPPTAILGAGTSTAASLFEADDATRASRRGGRRNRRHTMGFRKKLTPEEQDKLNKKRAKEARMRLHLERKQHQRVQDEEDARRIRSMRGETGGALTREEFHTVGNGNLTFATQRTREVRRQSDQDSATLPR
tara:strand:- start:1020 stop:4208 length:3189 start_codon:yes stop_codon:yes gene_type:complete